MKRRTRFVRIPIPGIVGGGAVDMVYPDGRKETIGVNATMYLQWDKRRLKRERRRVARLARRYL